MNDGPTAEQIVSSVHPGMFGIISHNAEMLGLISDVLRVNVVQAGSDGVVIQSAETSANKSPTTTAKLPSTCEGDVFMVGDPFALLQIQ